MENKMKKEKLLKLVMTLLLALIAIVAPISSAFADDTIDDSTKVNVTLNKLIWNDNAPTDFQNTGAKMNFDGSATPLNGSEFTLYDVTSQYYNYIANKSQQAAISQIQADASQVAPNYAKNIKSVTTAGQGQALFNDLSVKNKSGQYNVYLFLETKTPDNITVTKLSAPIVLAMPIYTLDKQQQPTDTLNQDIQLYPKNVTSKDTKEFTNVGSFSKVTVGDQSFANVTTGDVLNYTLTVNIPANIGDANAVNKYSIFDKPSDGLALVNNTVTVGSLTAGNGTSEDYDIAYVNGGFTVNLHLNSDNVKALAGKKIQLTYNMKLTADVNPDNLQSNKASVQINNSPEQQITPPTPVGTGGYKFIKKDAQTGKNLSGAEFVVANSDKSKFAKFSGQNSKGEYVFDSWVSKDQATKIVSGNDGSFNVIGLTNGNYVLNETKAPSANYVLLKDGTITFTVVHGKYVTSNLDVKNTPKGLLPSTGGAGIYAFIIIGAAMMIGAYIWFKKSRQQAEV